MSPMSPVMGVSFYTQGEWIVLRGGFHSPAIFCGEKRIVNRQRAVKPFCDAGLAAFQVCDNGRSKCFRLLA